MENTIKTKQINNNLRVRIVEMEENMNDPQEDYFYNGCDFVLTQNRHFYPNGTQSINDLDLVGNIDEDIKIIEKETGKKAFPLYAYIHDGVRLSLAPFSCHWDSGCMGFVLAEDEEMAKLFVSAWDNYLNEPEYGFIIEEREPLFNKDGKEVSEEWNELNSCYGYYSEDEALEVAMNCIPAKIN